MRKIRDQECQSCKGSPGGCKNPVTKRPTSRCPTPERNTTRRKKRDYEASIFTKMGKVQFVRNLCLSICNEVVAGIADEKVPVHWTGHELRYLLFLKFQHEVTSRMQDGRLTQRIRFRHEAYERGLL